MNASLVANKVTSDDLFELTNAERLWPEDKRIIYCSVTGKPWGYVSDEYVHYFIKHFGAREESRMQEIITRMTLFNGPSPLWQSKVPGMLLINQHIDPAGFLVYLLNTVLRLEVAARLDLDLLVKWRQSMVDTYAAFDAMDHAFLDDVNEAILLMTGEGIIPPLHSFPSRELLPYTNKEKLEGLLRICKDYYRKYRGRVNQLPMGQTYGKRNALHNKTTSLAYNTDKVDEKTRRSLMDLMLMDIFNTMDKDSTDAERQHAKDATGIASPTFQILKQMERELGDTPVQKKKTTAVVHEAGSKITIKIGSK